VSDSRTKRLTYLGLLVALAVVLTRFASVRLTVAGVENVRVGFGHFPVLFAGILYGPLAGAAVGALADLIGYSLSPMGPYMPHFTLAWALTGALPPLVLAALPRRPRVPTVGRLLVAIGVTQATVAVLLTSLFLRLLFGMPWTVTVTPRVVVQAVLVPVYATLTHMILRSVAGLAPAWPAQAAPVHDETAR